MSKFINRTSVLILTVMSMLAPACLANGVCLTGAEDACAPLITFSNLSGPGASSLIPSYANGSWTVQIYDGVYPDAPADRHTTSGFVTTDPDPSVAYSFAVDNVYDTPQTFLYGFTTPFVDGVYGMVYTDFMFSVVDGLAGPKDRVIDVGPNPVLDPVFLQYVMINDVLVPGSKLGTSCHVVAPAGFCSFTSTMLAYPVTGAGTLTILVGFTLSPGDRITLMGTAELMPVPEPFSGLLMGGGLLAFALFRRYRA